MQSIYSQAVVAVTGGGSGGHIYPALAVVSSLLERTDDSISIVWIGSRRGMERQILETQPVKYFAVPSGKLRRYISLRNLLDLFGIALGIAKSILVLLRTRPAVLFAKGGYVSVPPVVAARFLGIPIVAHESDLDPGLATRINGRFADRILVAYEESIRFFADRFRGRIEVTGVPVRRDLENADSRRGRDWICRGLDTETSSLKKKPSLLILGGSQGARRINELIHCQIELLCDDWIVVHQTGEAWKREPRDGYLPVAYLGSEYADVLAAADCVVSRAGATTLWEAALLEKAMVLIPLGLDASRGDQIRNAGYFESRGGAIALDSTDSDYESAFGEALHRIATDLEFRRNLGRVANEIVVEDSCDRVANALLSYLEKKES